MLNLAVHRVTTGHYSVKNSHVADGEGKKAAGNEVACEGNIKLLCVLFRTLCNLCGFRCFGGISCLHLQDKSISIFLQNVNVPLPENTVS